MKTPITYWGGKQQLVPVILGMIPPHSAYNEPFFGGGAVLFAKKPSEREYISDINAAMVNFYKVLRHNFTELKEMIDDTLYSEYQQKEARKIFKNGSDDKVRWAWSVWILSRQSKYANLNGTWQVSMRDNSAEHFNSIKRQFYDCYSRRLEHVCMFCRDAISQIKATDAKDTFHYCDPPYFNSCCGHYKGYSKDDFARLLTTLAEIKGKFLLSSYPSDVLEEFTLKHNWRSKKIEMTKSAGGKGAKKVEVLTYNYDTSKERQQCLFD